MQLRPTKLAIEINNLPGPIVHWAFSSINSCNLINCFVQRFSNKIVFFFYFFNFSIFSMKFDSFHKYPRFFSTKFDSFHKLILLTKLWHISLDSRFFWWVSCIDACKRKIVFFYLFFFSSSVISQWPNFSLRNTKTVANQQKLLYNKMSKENNGCYKTL